MIFGMINQIKIHTKITLLLLTFCFAAPVYSLELPELLQRFSQQKKSTADFKEEQHAFYLDEPLISSGYLQFIAPDKLYKFILKPEKISQNIEGDELHVRNGDSTHSININEYPEFSIALHALVNVLSGDHISLKNNFKIKFESIPPSWKLLLSPSDSFIASHVETITLFGNDNKLEKIIITQPNKDRSITHIYNHR